MYRAACFNADDVQVQSRMSIRPARRTAYATQASAEVPRRQALSAAAGAALLLFSGMFVCIQPLGPSIAVMASMTSMYCQLHG